MKKNCFGLLLSCLFGCHSAQMPDSQMVSYEYGYYNCTALPVLELEMHLNGSKVYVNLVQGSDTVRFEADKSLIDEVQRVFAEQKMYKYKPSYSPRFEVLDGYSWRYSAKFADGASFASGGSNAWPSGDALRQIAALVKQAAGL
ncbi:MAG: hypothetical protein ILP24_03735 [Paludibacteraceae bacterium]|nr:hypothetical protein [Paludibacteraceae bacterium]